MITIQNLKGRKFKIPFLTCLYFVSLQHISVRNRKIPRKIYKYCNFFHLEVEYMKTYY